MKVSALVMMGLGVGLTTSAFAEKLVKTGDTVAMMGDSITQYGTADSAGYVQLFLRAIRKSGAKVNFVGAGVAGNTSNQMRERFIRDVVEKKPTVVTINSGVNDAAFYSFPAQFDVYRDNIDFMVKAAQGAGAKVVLMTPTGTGGEKPNAIVAKLADIMREYAASHEGVILADSHKNFRAAVDDPSAPAMGPSGNKATVDGLHMGPVGNRAMARSLVSVMGLTAEEIAAVEADWNVAPIVGVGGVPAMSLAEYDLVEGYCDRMQLDIWEAATDALNAGIDAFLKDPALPSGPALPKASAAADCEGGDVAFCGGFNWQMEADFNPSGLNHLIDKAFAANGSDRKVVTGAGNGANLVQIDAKFDKIVAPAKGSKREVSHLVIAPSAPADVEKETAALKSVLAKARAKNIKVVLMTIRANKGREPAFNDVLRDCADGSAVSVVDAIRIFDGELKRRAANSRANIVIHGNGRLNPRVNYLQAKALLPKLGFNAAALANADAYWNADPAFGGSSLSGKISFSVLDRIREIAKRNGVAVNVVIERCIRLGAARLPKEKPAKGALKVDAATLADGTVLEPNAIKVIAGETMPRARVTVYRKGNSAVGYAGEDGRFAVSFDPGDEDGAARVSVFDGVNRVNVANVAVGSAK